MSMIEIIDFERLNKLTADTNEIPEQGFAGAIYKYNTSRKVIKEYMQVYQDYISKSSNSLSRRQYNSKYGDKELYVETILETLRYNKILINKREIALNSVLETKEES